MQLPAGDRAERSAQRDPTCDRSHRSQPAARRGETFELARHRLGEQRLVGRAHFVIQPAIGSDALGFFRPRGEPGLDRGVPIGREAAVGIGLQIGLGNRQLFAHFTTLRRAAASCPAIIARSFSRARDRRDITVPIGMPSVRATSS